MPHYLCRFEGLVEPVVIAGPFEDDIPDDVIIKALEETSEEDLLFGLTITMVGVTSVPKTWSFSNRTMDELRKKSANDL